MGKRSSAPVGDQTPSPSKRPQRSKAPDDDAAAEAIQVVASRTVDWSNLDEGPAGLIADRVLAHDVAGYICFRAVCRAWRRCCGDPRTRAVLKDRRLHPRRWIMLVGEGEKLAADAAPHCVRRRFLNVSSGQCIQVDVPELRDHGVLRSTTEGLLLLVGAATPALRLLNPLTRQVAELPPIDSTDGMDDPRCYIGNNRSPSSAGLVDDHTVLLYFHGRCSRGTMAFAKPGDERWVLVKTKPLMLTMSFAGRFYGVTSDAIMTVDTTTREGEDLPPRLVVAAKLATPIRRIVETAHLVETGGELMLVHRMMRRFSGDDCDYRRKYKLYRVNLAKRKVTPASAYGHAIFIGLNRALSVHHRVFPTLSANTVYIGLNLEDRGGNDKQIGAYHLGDGRTEFFNYDTQSGLAHPWSSIAYCLSAYVSG